MQLDLFGIAITAVLAFGFVLLLIGVYSAKVRENSLNLLRHGFLSAVATVVTIGLVFWVMIPFFSQIVGFESIHSFVLFPVMWLHALLGAVSIGLAVVMLFLWVKQPLGELGCSKAWRFMKPTLAIWGVAILLGAFIHIHGLT
jgi:uncharacterized membrane protein YozB (DUF420 family)